MTSGRYIDPEGPGLKSGSALSGVGGIRRRLRPLYQSLVCIPLQQTNALI
jgi:hypothetical protein